MEKSVQTKSNRAYGWALVAAVATALLVAVPFLALPESLSSDASLSTALSTLLFLLRVILFVPLFAVTPALWARSAWRTHPAVLAALALLAFAVGAVFGGAMQGLYALGLIAPAGVFWYAAQRAKLTNFKTVFYGSIVLLLGLFIRISGPAMASDGDAFLPMRSFMAVYLQDWNEMTAAIEAEGVSAVDAAMMQSLSEILQDLKLNAEEYMIELLYYPAAFAALTSALLSHAFNRKGGAELPPLPPFADWMVERSYIYGVLVLTVAAYGMVLGNVSIGNALLRITYVIWVLPLALAGLCTVKRWTKRRPWIFAIVLAVSISLLGQSFMVLSMVGMVGFFQKQLEQRMQGRKQ
ncbi:MAG: DUF2232 domain-containing protein [Clostridia bacterium]|nr:DUF2232 domain-containing protein [Clostridia bacterium]